MARDQEERPRADDIALIADDQGPVEWVAPDLTVVLLGLRVSEGDDAGDPVPDAGWEELDGAVGYRRSLASVLTTR